MKMIEAELKSILDGSEHGNVIILIRKSLVLILDLHQICNHSVPIRLKLSVRVLFVVRCTRYNFLCG